MDTARGIIEELVKLLEPKIVAEFWIRQWDESISEKEKQLISWVDDLFFSAMQTDVD
ncbi:MAG: hypothetical protein AAGC74_08190 [Verrucomicrobiota bacterium]